MKILIEISEESYNKLMQKSMLMSASAIDEAVDAVKKGRVLPKSHGRLIDANEAIELVNDEFDGVCVYDVSTSEAINDFESIIYRTKTVIPADKKGEN